MESHAPLQPVTADAGQETAAPAAAYARGCVNAARAHAKQQVRLPGSTGSSRGGRRLEA